MMGILFVVLLACIGLFAGTMALVNDEVSDPADGIGAVSTPEVDQYQGLEESSGSVLSPRPEIRLQD